MPETPRILACMQTEQTDQAVEIMIAFNPQSDTPTATATRPNRLRTFLDCLRKRIWFVGFTLACAGLVYPRGRNLVLGVEVTPAERGHQVAVEAGCFDCHGPDGIGGVKNPGSAYGEVPGFADGTPMMWSKNEQELREYVLKGAPARKLADPLYKREMEAQLLTMPAYGSVLSHRQVDDLIVYLRAVSGLITPTDAVAANGQELAYRYGCFNCHGPMGAGTSRNMGSLKGYIPGWWGNDFRDLVHSEEELRGWINDGEIARLRDHPVARYFTRSQRVSMPAYHDFMPEKDLEALMQYVRWVNAGGWRSAPRGP
jgi:mono/diheme cytochrome c family protein